MERRNQPAIILKPDKDKPVRNRHPWVFSGAIARVEGEPDDGDLVQVVDPTGRYLATGYLNRCSQIMVRLLSWNADEPIDEGFWRRRLERAILGRAGLACDRGTDAYRLVNAEADGLPGLVVDRYGEWLVIQCLTLGMAARRELIVALLQDLAQPQGIYARDDADVRLKEGLSLDSGPLRGAAPPDRLAIHEHGHAFLVDVRRGHKTGFYLDQRDNRRRVAAYAAGAEVLNAFAYTGAFGVYAGCAGARSIVHADGSAEALTQARQNVALNGLDPHEIVVADLFELLRRYRAQGRYFDLVILDPPKFANSKADLMSATRGYKDLNLVAMQILRPGGLLATFSCSGLVSADLFQKVVFGASVDARRDVQIVEHLSQASDHPVLLAFPESAYLKGLLCRVW